MKDFKSKVNSLVASIPAGKVMTYGQIAAICDKPLAARIVGGIAHYGDPKLPWHRVVNRFGGLATGYPGGQISHKKHLEAEDIKLINDRVIMHEYLWQPKNI